MPSTNTPFRIATPWRGVPAIGPAMLGLAEHALAFERLANIYRQLEGSATSTADFAARALDMLEVRFELPAGLLSRIPPAGPAVIVANHPFGGLEGLFLIAELMRYRTDVRLLANRVLTRLPALREAFFAVDVLGDEPAASNFKPVRAALRHVETGGLLVLFPAGVVSHLHLSAGRICDPPWQRSAARLVRRCACPVVPVYFGGGNSVIFQSLGLLHASLRTVMLTRELLNKRRRTIPVRIGQAISAQRLARIDDDGALASFLRMRTYALEARALPSAYERPCVSTPSTTPVAARLIDAEMQSLPNGQVLAQVGAMIVVHARAAQIPWTLRELGRLREIEFRAVGEGSGRDADLDAFDAHYVHLIAYHRERQRIVGAYRLGHVDAICAEQGRRGLYTHTLFAYGQRFLRQLGPALELGRSFVTREYQKDLSALLLLWKGIGQYVVRHPQYHVLFGPVSISRDYHPASRALLLDFLRKHCLDATLTSAIRPRRKFHRTHSLATLNNDLAQLKDIEDISSLLEEIEPDSKGVPVLLRQYLKLGGRLASFNVDAAFSDAIDALIVVDLHRTDRRVLQKYMGREPMLAFLARSGGDTPQPPAMLP